MADTRAKVILVGCGPHAQRVYLPALRRFSKETGTRLSLVIDLKAQEDTVRTALAASGLQPTAWFIDPFRGPLPPSVAGELSAFAAQEGVTGVIVATEPLTHRAYAEWALRQGLSLLLDKPITTRENVTSDLAEADGIEEDYRHLYGLYEAAQARGPTAFVVNAQRRFHPGFRLAEQLLAEVGSQTNCPVTFVQSYHCDGQWRFPSEIVTQDYHPYCRGYGKASHSGYHIFDAAYRLYAASGAAGKFADAMEIVSSFIQPAGFLSQLTQEDYEGLFGARYRGVRRWSDDDLRRMVANLGEIDLSAGVRLTRGGEAVANLSINLLHNGFARRTWVRPGSDLYKGNGRVKHEHHNVQQGPFQNIQIHSYQAKDVHDRGGPEEEGLGGNNHFEVYVFRNPLVSGQADSLQVYRLPDIERGDVEGGGAALVMERVKHEVVREFLEFLLGHRPKESLRSPLEDHLVPVQLMSGVYRSHVLRERGANPVVAKALSFENAPRGRHRISATARPVAAAAYDGGGA
jgi:hypothetical protein